MAQTPNENRDTPTLGSLSFIQKRFFRTLSSSCEHHWQSLESIFNRLFMRNVWSARLLFIVKLYENSI